MRIRHRGTGSSLLWLSQCMIHRYSTDDKRFSTVILALGERPMSHVRLPLALLLFPALCAAGTPSPRIRQRFDDGWRFLRGPESAPVSALGPFRWQWRTANVRSLAAAQWTPDVDAGDWRDTRLGRTILSDRQRFAWFRTDLGSNLADRTKHLHFASVDDNAKVWLNGVLVAEHNGYGEPFDVAVAPAWNPTGPNRLVVLVENTGGPGGIDGGVTLESPLPPEDVPAEARPTFPDRAWRTVHLPHDYVVEGLFRKGEDVSHGSLPRPTAWYRKTFVVPKSYQGRRVWIDFDGVYRNSTVYLNGRKLGKESSGYIGFRYDLTDRLRYGQRNVLAVHVDPTKNEGWWYEGGGIYRHVWLNVSDPVHIDPDDVFVRSEVDEPLSPASEARLYITLPVHNDSGKSVTAVVRSRVVAPSGKTAAELWFQARIAPGGTYFPHYAPNNIGKPSLWSIEHPNLYRLETTVKRDGQVVDRLSTTFGVRTIRFDKDRGFFLNGRPVKLKGTCNHQDHAGVGVAIPDGLFDWRVRRLKEMGSNAYRCSHNPPARELLDACDRLGMLVLDETRHLGDATGPKSPSGTTANDLSELKRMVRRDRNHPSVFAWSLYNEEPLQGTEEGARIYEKMVTAVRALDPTRPCTGATNWGYDKGIVNVAELFGINYNIGVYDDVHRRHPDQPLFGSETASTVSTRGIYANDPVKGYVSAYDLNHPGWAETAENAWRPIAERPWMAGGFVWTGFDYKGEPTPYGWPCINSHFGILDICGFPKDNFYYYKAWWGVQPVVHILPHWNWRGQEGKTIKVWAHSNADAVELLVNGESLGVKAMPRYGHLEWDVPYHPGTLVARGYRNGRVIASDRVETTDAPAAIRLKTTRPALLADNEDVSPVEVEIVDSKGRVVPTADNLVRFTVSGPAHIAGVGNGDPSSHEPDKASQRHAFNGFCMAIVQTEDKPGRITLTATAPGLKPATIKLSSR